MEVGATIQLANRLVKSIYLKNSSHSCYMQLQTNFFGMNFLKFNWEMEISHHGTSNWHRYGQP